eukprot:scaffold300_cov258-Pinguiococcus_pyrenoidosus.AAC.65
MSIPVPQLYRRILKLAKVFPSKNRESIYREIQLQFHRDKTLTDPTVAPGHRVGHNASGRIAPTHRRLLAQAIAERLSVAHRGVQQLSMYTNLQGVKGDWSVTLEQNPFPKPPEKVQDFPPLLRAALHPPPAASSSSSF